MKSNDRNELLLDRTSYDLNVSKLLNDENEKLKIEIKDQLKSNDRSELLLDRTRYDLNVSLISCLANYCDVQAKLVSNANTKLTLFTVETEI